jgi:Carboxypeptidase regulatory-like domain/TonB-dependent Receptor Plug Domain
MTRNFNQAGSIMRLLDKVILAWLAIPALAYAQASRTGEVVDASTGQPVADATVIVVTTGETAVTDANGDFTLPDVAPGAEVMVVGPGFAERTITIGDSAVRVELVPSADGGAEVIELQSERVRPAPGAATLDREEIKRVPGARGDVLSSIKNLPGVANNGSLTPLSAGLIIRGASPEDSRILVDGFEVPVLYHFLGLQSVIPSEMVDEIEYVPGGFDVSVGGASAGIVSVTSRRGSRELGATAELSFVNGAAFIEGPVGERGSFAVAARRSVIDAILPAVLPDDGSVAFTAYPRYYDAQAQLTLPVDDRLTLSAFVFGSDDGFDVISGGDNASDPAAGGGASNDTSFARAIAAATWATPSTRLRLAASGYTDTNHFQIGGDRYLRLDRDGAGARLELEHQVTPRLVVTGGAELDVTRNGYDIRFTRPPREGDPMAPSFTYDTLLTTVGATTTRDVGGWLSATGRRGRAELTAGARVDGDLRGDHWIVQPRAQGKLRLSERVLVRAATGLYTRPSRLLDENLQPELEPERAINNTLGVEQRLTDELSLQGTGFYNRLSRLTVLDGSRRDDASRAGYVNVGTGAAFGAEALVTFRRRDVFGWLAYTYTHATRTDGPMATARRFDYDQSHNLIAVGSWRLGRRGDWQLGARFQLTTGRPYTPVTGALYASDVDGYQPRFGAVNSQRVATQHQLDLRVDRRWRFADWTLAAYLDVSNTYLNAAVVDYAYNFDYSERQAVTTLPILPSLGIRGEL